MGWEIKNGIVKDEYGEIVCLIAESASDYHIALIQNASNMYEAIMKYNRGVENTRLPRNPKKDYEEFRKLEQKIKGEIG